MTVKNDMSSQLLTAKFEKIGAPRVFYLQLKWFIKFAQFAIVQKWTNPRYRERKLHQSYV